MTKIIKKILLIVCLLIAVFTVAHFALALDVGLDEVSSEIGLAVVDPRIIVARVINIILGFLGIIAVGLIIYAGWLWMTAAGNEERIQQAKKILINAVIGLVIILSSFAIASFILSRLIAATSGGSGGGACGGGSTCAPDQHCCWDVCVPITTPCGSIPPPDSNSFRIISTIPRNLDAGAIRNVVIKAFFNKAADTVNLDTNFRVEKIADIDPVTGEPTDPADPGLPAIITNASRAFANGGRVVTFKDTTACGDEKNTPNCFAAWSKFKVTINGSANPLNGANGLFSIDNKPLSCSAGSICQFVFSTNNLIDASGPQAGIVPTQICKTEVGVPMKSDANTVTGWGRDDVGISGLSFYQQKLIPLPAGTEIQALVVPGNEEKYQSVEHTYLTTGMTVGDTYKLRVEAVDLADQLASSDFSTTIRPGHCCNGIKDGTETDIDCGGVGLDRCGACDGAACATDISIPTNNNNCSANNNLCASQFCTSQNSGVTSCQDAGYAAGTTNCCLCQRPPVITGVFPVGGFCSNDNNKTCLINGDCGTGNTCNTNTPNGAVGNFVTIVGRNFGAKPSSAGSGVFFSGTTAGTWVKATLADDDSLGNSHCTDNVWSDGQIIAIVPAGTAGNPIKNNSPIKVVTQAGFSDDSAANPILPNFFVNTISRPGICELTPNSGKTNDLITYYGIELTGNKAYFGNWTASTSALSSIFTDASGKQGTAQVSNIQTGRTTSFVAKGLVFSNYLSFTKEPEPYSGPVISSFDPKQGSAGQYVTISGRGFGNTKGASEVYFGTVAEDKKAGYNFPAICADSIWSDKQVIVKVPAKLSDPEVRGSYKISMKIAKGGGQYWEIDTNSLNPSQFDFNPALPLAPSLCKIEPIMGQTNSPISLWGEYFGVNSEDYSKVRFQLNHDQVGAAVTSWGVDPEAVPAGTRKPDKAVTTVHQDTVTGPVKAVKTEVIQGTAKELIGNGLNFTVGVCQNTAECGSESLCCSIGTPYAGQCKAGADAQTVCFPEIKSCVYEWNFSTLGKTQCLATQTVCGRSCCAPGDVCVDPNGNNGNGRCDSINCPNGVTCGNNCCTVRAICSDGLCSSPQVCAAGQVSCNIPGAPAGTPPNCCNNGQCNQYTGQCDSCPPNQPDQCGDGSCCSDTANCRDIDNNPATTLTVCADPESCSGYGGATQGCYGQLCPNSPGSCSTRPAQTNVDTGVSCGNDACLAISQCRGAAVGQNLCSYNASFNKCQKISDICSLSRPLSGNASVTEKCGTVDNKNVWYYDSNQTCVSGYTKSIDRSKCLGAACNICSTGFSCQSDGGAGICVTNANICPVSSICNASGRCIKTDNAACECCCDITQNDSTNGNNPGCCTGLSCGGTCGADTSLTDGPGGSSNIGLGQCTGCTNAGSDQAARNAACNCLGTSGKFCDTAGAGGKGVCKDCAQLSTAGLCSGLGAGTCCVDAKNSNACRKNTAYNASGGPVYATGATGDANNYCAYYNCGTGSSANQCQAAPLKNGNYKTTTCDNKCAFPPRFGQECVKILPAPAAPQCDNSICAGFSCLNDTYPTVLTPPNNCGICCCDPNAVTDQCSAINDKLSCIKNKGLCAGANRGLCCGCSKDSECGDAATAGCGSDTCCQARPSVISTVPANGATNICRNTMIKATFNQAMQIGTLAGNVIVAGDYGASQCPAGTEYLTAVYKPTILARVKSFLSKLPLVNKLFASDAWALPGNFCTVLGSASGYIRTGASGVETTIMEFKLQKALEPNQKYYVIIKGDSDLTDAVNNGVLSQAGVGMNGQGYNSVNPAIFNGLSFVNAKIWSFTTKASASSDSGICQVDSVSIIPSSYLFKTAASEKIFQATAYSADGQPITRLPAVYNWRWDWTVDNQAVVKFKEGVAAADNSEQTLVAQNIKDANTLLHAKTTITQDAIGSTMGATEEAAAQIYVFLCANPWPLFKDDGSWEPWRDSSNCNVPGTAGTGCPDTGFELYYCRDAGGEGTADDLPAILSNTTVIRGTNLKCRSNNLNCDDGAGSCASKVKGDTCGDGSGKCDYNVIGSCSVDAAVDSACGSGTCQVDLLKELYFFRESLPNVTGITLATTTNDEIKKGGKAGLTWSAIILPTVPPIPVLDKYKVYYGTASGNYTDSIDAGTATSKEISGLTNGRKYYFAVTAKYKSGAESAYSNETTAIPADTTAPAVPSILWVLPTTDSTATIGWRSNSDDTVNYKAYYGASKDSAGAIIYGASINVNKSKCFGPGCMATITNLNPGTTYYFAVAALDAAANKSATSIEKSLKMVLASRAKDLAQLAAGFYRYAGEHGGAFPNYGASCLGVPTEQRCWNGYVTNLRCSDNSGNCVDIVKGQPCSDGNGICTNIAGISGNTALNNALAPYISKIPFDPKKPRSVGDAYIYFQGNADINCYEATRESGAWIVWEPDRLFYTNDRDDSFCGLNSRTACCSALGCSANSFCVFKMN